MHTLGPSLHRTRKLVEPHLHLKGGVAVLLIHLKVTFSDEGDLLIRSLCAQDIACNLVSLGAGMRCVMRTYLS